MPTLSITNTTCQSIINHLKNVVQGDLENCAGAYKLTFDNKQGAGQISGFDLDHGVTYLQYAIHLNQPEILDVLTEDNNCTRFVFVSRGRLDLQLEDYENLIPLERFQNIIYTPKRNSASKVLLPANEDLEISVIYITKSHFHTKKNYKLSDAEINFATLFKNSNTTPFVHKGGYSLEIAVQIKKLRKAAKQDNSMIKMLTLEGRISLIIALQIDEYRSSKSKDKQVSHHLSSQEVQKIESLTTHILENLQETLTIEELSKHAGLYPKKLQLGFKILYGKSVNAFVRDTKLEIAREMLESSNDTISEVVFAIGLRSRSYFSKIFAEKYGMLPIDFRKKMVH